MRTTEPFRQALYFCPLLLGAAAILRLPSRTVAPGALFVVIAIYAHAAARILGATGMRKATLFLEALPFFGFAAAMLGKLDVIPTLLMVGSSIVAAAAILLGEWLILNGTATFTTSVGFIASCCIAGLGLTFLPAFLFLGLALLTLTITGYGAARRVRG